MLALVKKPHIEISLHGEQVDELLAWIRKKFEISVLAAEPADELVSIESTDYWREMEKNRVGNLLAGARLKAGLTQTQLAHELGIRQNMVSDYENGRRSYSDIMAKRLSAVLQVKEDHLKYGCEPTSSGEAAMATRRGRPLARILPADEPVRKTRQLGERTGEARQKGDMVRNGFEADWESLR